MGLEIGSHVAQYRLERRLGAGGMGEVYLARDTTLGRSVAIKFLNAPQDEPSKRRLLHEARAAAGLDHPGICAVYEVGEDPAAGAFIAMQYVEGETLASRLRRGRLRPDEAMALAARIAEALVVAHHHGVVHRDLKPQNIIVTASGAPKLLDFGLATHVPSTAAAANAITSSELTDPHMVVGTPGYMAPEQIRGGAPDFRTDVFALGCVLYECLTGARAFTGATTAEVLGQILHVDPAPPSSIVTALGPAYDALLERLLHKNCEQRFQSAEEVLGAVRALTPSVRLSNSRAVGRSPGRQARGRLWLAAAVLIAGTGYAGLQYWRATALATPTAEAAGWYARGVEAMRDGAYAGAREAFREATQLFPSYAQAFARLAEAHIALDDEKAAREAVLQMTALVPNLSRLRKDDRLRFTAAREAALRRHSAAIAAYRELVDRQPGDAGRWLDLGRAQHMANLRAAALESYSTAVKHDGQNAAAHLRMGVLLVQTGQTTTGFAAIDEALRLYRAAGNSEGEAQAHLDRGTRLSNLNRFKEALPHLMRVLEFATDGRYAGQRVLAHYQLARLDYFGGRFAEAEARAKAAMAEAIAADLVTVAAQGCLQVGNALLGRRRYEDALAQFEEASRLASMREAIRIKMQAQASQASAHLQLDHPQQALDLALPAMKYFADTSDPRLEMQAKAIAARAHEGLEHYEEARQLTDEALRFAEATGDNGGMTVALDNIAGQLSKLGRLPEALATRERLTDLTRRTSNHADLPRHVLNQARLLVLLGRGADADTLIGELRGGVDSGAAGFVDVGPQLIALESLRAVTEGRHADVRGIASRLERAAGAASPSSSIADARRMTRILVELADARLGRSRTPVHTLTEWPSEAATPTDRREQTFWVVQALLARGALAEAHRLASATLAEPGCRVNPELTWRLAAVAALAEKGQPATNGASMAALALKSSDEISKAAAWAQASAAYFARPDLKALRESVR